MAKDVITRFKLESNQFDSALKRASKELTDFSKTATQSGKGFNDFTKKNIEAARALGNTATGSTNAKDKLRELTQAFNETARAYNALSKEQKQSDFAQALAGSLTQLQQRIRETKAEMQSLSNVSMPNISAGSGGSDPFAGLTATFTKGNLYAMAISEATSALQGFAAEMQETIKQGVEMARQGEGIRIAFERLNQPGLLKNLKEATHGTVSELELMKQAVKFNDFKLPVEQLGTLLEFAQKKAKDTGQSVDYMVDSIVTGLGRKSLMILDNLGLSAAQIKEEMKKSGDMTTAVANIIKQQMAEAGDYVETAADRAARKQAELADKSEELGRRLMEASEKADEFNMTLKLGTLQVLAETYEGLQVLGNAADSVGRQIKKAFEELGIPINQIKGFVIDLATELENTSLVGVSALGAIKTAAAGLISPLMGVVTLLREIGKEANKNGDPGLGAGIAGSIGGTVFNKPISPISDSSSTNKKGKGGNTGKKEKSKTEYEQNEAAIKALANEYAKLASKEKDLTQIEEQRMSAIQAQIAILQERNKKYKEYLDIVQGKQTNKFENGEIGKYEEELAKLQQSLKHADTKEESREISNEIEILTIKLKELRGEYDKIFEKGNLTDMIKATKELEKLSKLDNSFDSEGNVVVNGKKRIGVNAAFEQAPLNNTNMSGFISYLQQELNKADVGGAVFNALTERLKDASMMKSVFEAMVKGGVESADFTEIAAELKKKLLDGDITDEDWEKFQDKINSKIKKSKYKINIDGEKGTVKQGDDKAAINGVSQIIGGISSINGAMKQLGIDLGEDFGKVLGGMQAVTSILTTISSIVAAIQVITAADSFLPFASGGTVPHAAAGFFVPGNNFSGDRVHMALNSGELVLNKAQQGNLASQLTDNGGEISDARPYTTGENIVLGINAHFRRSGQGEIVTTSMLRRMGLT